jgi:hypothetical protein
MDVDLNLNLNLNLDFAKDKTTPINSTDTNTITNTNTNNCVIEFNFGGCEFEVEYKSMVETWMDLYNDENINRFTLVFKAREEGVSPPISYVYRLSKFIREIKKLRKNNPVKYGKLEQTIVMITSSTFKTLLDMLFTMITPLSAIYITSTHENVEKIIGFIERQEDVVKNTTGLEGVKYISVK